MSHPIWSLVVRVNYVVLLIQVEVIYWMFQTRALILSVDLKETLEMYVIELMATY